MHPGASIPPSAAPVAAAPSESLPAGDLLRLHASLNGADLWHALRHIAGELIPCRSLTLEIGRSADGLPRKVFRRAHPYTPREWRREHPDRVWLALHPGAPVYRFSDIAPAGAIAGSLFQERVMRKEGWDHLLCVAAWDRRSVVGALNFHRAAAEGDFTAREIRLAEALQPQVETAIRRVLEHEEAVYFGGQVAALLESVPVGLLLLDWELKPLWFNSEAAIACAVWNHGERSGAAMVPRRAFKVPPPLAEACAQMRLQWEKIAGTGQEGSIKPQVVSDHAIGLHVQIALRAAGKDSLQRPAFHIELDYRRPRGDRHRAVSPGALALLARLSSREREVAMYVREGMRTDEIAAALRRSPLTIKTQLTSIFVKLGAHNRTRVAALLNR